jgi:regulator of protease activity HflC (stomatin/prohibitin superfamily)
MRCKVCGTIATIPGGPPPPDEEPPPAAPEQDEPEDIVSPVKSLSVWRDPVKLGLSIGIVCLSGILLFLVFLGLLFSKPEPPMGLVMLALISLVVSVVSGALALQLFVAKHKAITAKDRPVPLFFGLAHLMTWEQNEGVIFLRDKRISETIYGPKSGGGLRIVYSVLGEELRARVPLTIQLTWFRDERVLTRESIQMKVKAAIWWQVSELEKYFYRIDQEVHSLRDRDVPGEGVSAVARRTARGQLSISEVWVQTLVESCLRKLISDTSTFLIVSKRAATHLHVGSGHESGAGHPSAGDDPRAATPDVIGHRLMVDLAPRLKDYGLKIDRVEIQEVQLPADIQRAVDDVWIASTLPTKSAHESQALETRLEVLCRMLGKETVGVSEIVGRLPAGAFMSNPLAWLPAIFEQLAGVAKAPTGGSLPPTSTPAPLPPVPPAGP